MLYLLRRQKWPSQCLLRSSHSFRTYWTHQFLMARTKHTDNPKVWTNFRDLIWCTHRTQNIFPVCFADANCCNALSTWEFCLEKSANTAEPSVDCCSKKCCKELPQHCFHFACTSWQNYRKSSGNSTPSLNTSKILLLFTGWIHALLNICHTPYNASRCMLVAQSIKALRTQADLFSFSIKEWSSTWSRH